MSDREAFEKWWISRGYNPELLQREADGYRDGMAQVACFARQAQAQAGDGEAVDKAWLRFQAALNDDNRAKIKAGGGEAVELKFPTMLRKMWSGREVQDWFDNLPALYTAPPPAVARQDLIDLLIATRTQSEGVTADLIIEMVGAKPAVNQQLMEALQKAESHLHAMMAHIEHKPQRFQEHCWQQVLDIKAAIAAAQEQK